MEQWVDYILPDKIKISKRVAHNIEDIKKNLPKTENGKDEKIFGFVTYNVEDGKRIVTGKYYVGILQPNGYSYLSEVNNCLYQNPQRNAINLVDSTTFKLVPMNIAHVGLKNFQTVSVIVPSMDLEKDIDAIDRNPDCATPIIHKGKTTGYTKNYISVRLSKIEADKLTGLAKETETKRYSVGYLSGYWFKDLNGFQTIISKNTTADVYDLTKNQVVHFESEESEYED